MEWKESSLVTSADIFSQHPMWFYFAAHLQRMDKHIIILKRQTPLCNLWPASFQCFHFYFILFTVLVHFDFPTFFAYFEILKLTFSSEANSPTKEEGVNRKQTSLMGQWPGFGLLADDGNTAHKKPTNKQINKEPNTSCQSISQYSTVKWGTSGCCWGSHADVQPALTQENKVMCQS